MADVVTRYFREADIPQLVDLMYELAVFEGYDSEFAISQETVKAKGLCSNPDFHAIVASREDSESLLGMAVFYFIPYTYTLKPDLVLKELFVHKRARGYGVGQELFKSVLAAGNEKGCGQIIWTVMNGNDPAKNFYLKQGGKPDRKWERWAMRLD